MIEIVLEKPLFITTQCRIKITHERDTFPSLLIIIIFSNVQYIFSPEIGDVSKMSDLEAYNHAVHGICNLQSKLTDLPLGRPSKAAVMGRSTLSPDTVYPYMFLSSHSHFVNYGGE